MKGFYKGHKIRNTGRTRFKKGQIPWNKGLTKETNKILMGISKKSTEQMHREYKNGIRDKFKITKKAIEKLRKFQALPSKAHDSYLKYMSSFNPLLFDHLGNGLDMALHSDMANIKDFDYCAGFLTGILSTYVLYETQAKINLERRIESN